MNILVRRNATKQGTTTGTLTIDNQWICYTLEDEVRSGPKIPGRTAIPPGTYTVNITMSARFKKLMPLLLNVPNFEGVRIHCGNKHEDTEGCLLVGSKISPSGLQILESRVAYNKLFSMIDAAIKRKEQVTITLENSK